MIKIIILKIKEICMNDPQKRYNTATLSFLSLIGILPSLSQAESIRQLDTINVNASSDDIALKGKDSIYSKTT